ncbi:MAG: hypothetical protein AAF607_06235 [Pseudomonadota bacterium]
MPLQQIKDSVADLKPAAPSLELGIEGYSLYIIAVLVLLVFAIFAFHMWTTHVERKKKAEDDNQLARERIEIQKSMITAMTDHAAADREKAAATQNLGDAVKEMTCEIGKMSKQMSDLAKMLVAFDMHNVEQFEELRQGLELPPSQALRNRHTNLS